MSKLKKIVYLLILAIAMLVFTIPALADDPTPIVPEPIPIDEEGPEQVPLMPKNSDPNNTSPTQVTPNPNGCVLYADEDPNLVNFGLEVEGTGRVECNVNTHVYLQVCLQKRGLFGVWYTVGCDHNDAIDDLLYVAHTEACSSEGWQDWRVKNYAEAYISGTTYYGSVTSDSEELYCNTL